MGAKRICVFCGSSSGRGDRDLFMARRVGAAIAEQGWELVYGGASVGLMGAMADGCLYQGGQVCGVIPKVIVERELAHQSLTELHQVGSMHDRKWKMYELSSAFLALPGGVGTLDELFEVQTWQQLKLHSAPIAILNFEGFYDYLLAHLERAVARGFLSSLDFNRIGIFTDIDPALEWLDRQIRENHT